MRERPQAVAGVQPELLAERPGARQEHPRQRPAAAAGERDGAAGELRAAERVEHARARDAEAVHQVHVVHERAEERVRVHADVVRPVGPELLGRLLGGRRLEPRRHGARHVRRAHEAVGSEAVGQSRVDGDAVDPDELGRGSDELVRQPLVRLGEALHVPDLHDAPAPRGVGRDALRVGHREAERLLHEHVETGVERVGHDRGVRAVGTAHDDRVERLLEQPPVVGVRAAHAIARREGGPDRSAGVGERRHLGAAVRGEPREVDRLGDETTPDHADAELHGSDWITR